MARLEPLRLYEFSHSHTRRHMKTFTGQMLGYAAASGCALVVDVGMLAFLVQYCSWWYLTAASASFMTGVVVAYRISTHYVFSDRRIRNRPIEFISFAAIGALGLALNAAVIFTGVRFCRLNYLEAKCIAAGFTFICNFFSRRQLLFVQPASS